MYNLNEINIGYIRLDIVNNDELSCFCIDQQNNMFDMYHTLKNKKNLADRSKGKGSFKDNVELGNRRRRF